MLLMLTLLVWPASIPAVTLDDAILLAMQQNETLLLEETTTQRADAETLRAWGTFMPTVRSAANLQRSLVTRASEQSLLLAYFNLVSADIAQAVIDIPGTFTIRGAQAHAAAAHHTLQARRNEVALETTRLFAQALYHHAMVAVEDERIALAQTQHDLATQRVATGLAQPADGWLADAELAEAQRTRVEAQRSLEHARVELSQYVGSPVEQTDAVGPVLDVACRTSNDEATWQTTALQQRPDMQAALQQEAAATAWQWAGRLRQLPVLSIRASGYGSVQDVRETSVYVGADLTWTLFDGNYPAELHLRDIEVRDAQIRAAARRRLIGHEVHDGLVAVRALCEALRYAHQAADAATRHAHFMHEGYAAGLKDAQLVKLAVDGAARAQQSLALVQRDLLVAHVAWAAAVGNDLSHGPEKQGYAP